MAEYEALIAGLLFAINCGADTIDIISDSQLLVNEVHNHFQVKDQLKAYLRYVQTLLQRFKRFNIQQIPQSKIQRLTL